MTKPSRLVSVFVPAKTLDRRPDVVEQLHYLAKTAPELCSSAETLDDLENMIQRAVYPFDAVLRSPDGSDYYGSRDAIVVITEPHTWLC